jgi:hypothetical protein
MKPIKLLLIVLFVFASFNAAKWFRQFDIQQYHPLDFRTYYLGAVAFQKFKTPYNENYNDFIWSQIRDSSHNSWNSNTGFPHATVVYSPSFISVFSLFTLLPFNIAKWVQLVFNITSIFFIAYLIQKINSAWKFKHILLAIFAFKGTWFALSNGQPLFMILFACIYSIYLIKTKKQNAMAGLILGIVSFKFTLILPIAISLLFQKNFKAFFSCVISTLLLNAFILAFNPSMFIEWQNNIHKLWEFVHQNHLNALNIISTGISSSLKIAFNIPNNILKIGFIFINLSLYILVYFSKSKQDYQLFALLLIGFIFGQHLIYDLLFVLCIYLITHSNNMKLNWTKTITIVLILLPLGKISEILKMEIIQLVLPIGLLIFSIQVFYEEVLTKYNTTKKES